jgi:hypothetical protein
MVVVRVEVAQRRHGPYTQMVMLAGLPESLVNTGRKEDGQLAILMVIFSGLAIFEECEVGRPRFE